MDIYKTEKTVYTPDDFVVWREKGMLVISPKFQRRPVWRTPARSYFIDTILRGMTVPPMYLRMRQSDDRTKTVREVVDGQQRVRSVLDFIADEYRLAKTLNAEWAGKKFSQLTEVEQQRIMNFSFSAEVFKGISDQEVMQVFCRLNMNGIPLNKQELRNGKFFGLFKQAAYKLGFEYLEFWRHHKMFSEQGLARMLEVELTSELLIAGLDGMQDKKNSIDSFYEDYEEEYPTQARDRKRFNDVMGTISETFNGELSEGEFSRPPLFYSLYCVVFHHMFGMPEVQRKSPKQKLSRDDREFLKDAVMRLSDIVLKSKDPASTIPAKYSKFVAACLRQTDNISPRKVRFNGLYDEAF